MEYLQWLTPYLERYSYGIIFVSTLLDGLLIPAPSQILLISASLMAARSNMNIYLVLLSAWSGAIIGALLGYLLGHSAGRKWLLYYGKRLKLINETQICRIEHYFHRYSSGLVIVVSRFVDPLRQLISFIAGMLGMSFQRFISYTIVGTTLWVMVWGVGSYLLSAHVPKLFSLIKEAEPYLIGIGVAALLIALLYWLWRRRQRQRGIKKFYHH